MGGCLNPLQEHLKITPMNRVIADVTGKSPRLAAMRVIPVAGQDSMLLNLSGAHGPYFTRNLLLLTDETGNTGAGEVPGGEKIRRTFFQSLVNEQMVEKRGGE